MEILLYCMSALYVIAGIYHFANPKVYLKMMPKYLPWHLPLVYISGLFEIALGLLLIPEATRIFAAWGIIVLLIAIFPANIQMTVNFSKKRNRWFWISVIRLPLQLILIYWAFCYTQL